MNTLAVVARLCRGDAGAAVIEYAFIVSIVSLAAIVGFGAIGTNVSLLFASIAAAL